MSKYDKHPSRRRLTRHRAAGLAALAVGWQGAPVQAVEKPVKQPMYPETSKLNRQVRAIETELGRKIITTYVQAVRNERYEGQINVYMDRPNSRHPKSTLKTIEVTNTTDKGSIVPGYTGEYTIGATMRLPIGDHTMRGARVIGIYAIEAKPKPGVGRQPLASLSVMQRNSEQGIFHEVHGLFATKAGFIGVYGATAGVDQMNTRQVESVGDTFRQLLDMACSADQPTGHVEAPNLPAISFVEP